MDPTKNSGLQQSVGAQSINFNSPRNRFIYFVHVALVHLIQLSIQALIWYQTQPQFPRYRWIDVVCKHLSLSSHRIFCFFLNVDLITDSGLFDCNNIRG